MKLKGKKYFYFYCNWYGLNVNSDKEFLLNTLIGCRHPEL